MSQNQNTLRWFNRIAKRDPELYLLFGSVVLTCTGMGYWFGRSMGSAGLYKDKPQDIQMPWQANQENNGRDFKYKYTQTDGHVQKFS
ncbi:hypothetical protein V1511DRAFT_512356 [Dipodascopsis uninucleata]